MANLSSQAFYNGYPWKWNSQQLWERKEPLLVHSSSLSSALRRRVASGLAWQMATQDMLLPDPLITLKEHNTKNNKSGIVFYSREQCEDLCFTEQERFPRITDLLSGIRSDRKMQASAQVMGKKSWVTGFVCFLSFCGAGGSGNRISKMSNPPLCTEGCSVAWPFFRLTVSLPCTTSLLKGWEQPGSEMQFHSLLHNQLYSRMS